MIEPQRTSFHGDQSRVGNQPRAAPEDPEVVAAIREAERIVQELRREKRLTPEPFDEPIEFLYFNLWHSGGRTAKHGAFMGGADFVQWHGSYEVVSKLAELKKAAAELRQKSGKAEAAPRGHSEGAGHAPSTAR